MENTTDKRTITAPENGKKGGRPTGTVSEATIRTQLARDYISKQLQDSLAPIVAKALTQAMEGDKDARAWLSDRAWGKPQQNHSLAGEDGEPLIINLVNYGEINNPKREEAMPEVSKN